MLIIIIIISSFFSLAVDSFSPTSERIRENTKREKNRPTRLFIHFSFSLLFSLLSFSFASRSLSLARCVSSFYRSKYRERRDLNILFFISKRSVKTFLILLNRITTCVHFKSFRQTTSMENFGNNCRKQLSLVLFIVLTIRLSTINSEATGKLFI